MSAAREDAIPSARGTLSFKNAPGDSLAVALHVKGLRGGHSGLEIDKGRGNSIKIPQPRFLLLWKKLMHAFQ